ncbi:MAG: ATP-binding protein [Actinomycetota bacterium]|nr:ATP-binding protein [Actinomycetota bacterium]
MQIPYEKISAAVLATQPEDRFLEHKETLKYDIHRKQANPALFDAVIDRICGFWNGGGGTVLIGVQDRTGTVAGLERDLKLFKDLDAMVLQVTNRLHNEVPTMSGFVRVAPESIGDKQVLRVDTPAGNHPVYRSGRFLLRMNNSTSELEAPSVVPYIASRFPGMYMAPVEASQSSHPEPGSSIHDPRRDPDADPSKSFYHWTTLEGRLEELNNRLAAWYISGPQLPELFNEALRKLSSVYDDCDLPWEADPTAILQAFEEALDDFDNVLANFPPESSTEPNLGSS